MKKIFALILTLTLCLCLFAGCKETLRLTSGDGSSEKDTTQNAEAASDRQENEYGDMPVVEIENFGTVTVALDAEAAPITVANFLKLVESGFYDGLTFHRIDEGFMMQGGDPEGTGFGGSEEKIKGEFAANGVENPLSHTRGAISMARSNKPDSASSQFFICHQDSQFLDGQYACFGYVTQGMDVVDAICEYSLTVPLDPNCILNAEDQPVIKSIRVVD